MGSYNIEGIGNAVTSFDTGAVRDIQEDKGRCDLMPLAVIGDLYTLYICTKVEFANKYTTTEHINEVFRNINEYIYEGCTDNLLYAICHFLAVESSKGGDTAQFDDMLLDLSKHYKHGLEKYGLRNWEKGIPCHSFIDSGTRHFIKHIFGHTDERHDIAFIWNLIGCVHTQNYISKHIDNKQSILDLPCHKIKEED